MFLVDKVFSDMWQNEKYQVSISCICLFVHLCYNLHMSLSLRTVLLTS